jgi:aspartyl-tRNA(Asn)/glutamyl-tRNA(Gln) amidotransferase subunit B
MKWEVVIGLETHAQLSTASKIFSGASTAFGAPPNTQASAVDLALPGVLPVPNKGAVERAIRFGLAVKGNINRRSVFARKNYFYPDLPKGYQISQYEIPVVQGGTVEIEVKDGDRVSKKTVRLTRAHLEEDAGKSLHEDYHGMTGIDLNRAGTPLLEIVSEPDLRSAEEAVAYAKKLHQYVTWHDICDGNMQEGSFRCDANVSVRPAGQQQYGTRCEIKNLNSFAFMEKAIEFEVRRQIALIEDGGKVVQETRLYDPDTNETRPMRSKEDAMDYRYFPDPDLPPLTIDDAWIDRVANAMHESPDARRARFIDEYRLSEYDAALATRSRDTADYFEQATRLAAPDAAPGSSRAELAKAVANWMNGELAATLNREDVSIAEGPISAAELAEIVKAVKSGTISGRGAKVVFDELVSMWKGREGFGATPLAAQAARDVVAGIVASKGLQQISDSGAIEKAVDDVLAANAAQVADYKSGKAKAFNALVGQVMKATGGKANPAQVNELLRKKLDG